MSEKKVKTEPYIPFRDIDFSEPEKLKEYYDDSNSQVWSEHIKNTIDTVLTDRIDPTQKVSYIYSYEEREEKKKKSYISDSSYDIRNALNTSSLSADDINEIAEAAYAKNENDNISATVDGIKDSKSVYDYINNGFSFFDSNIRDGLTRVIDNLSEILDNNSDVAGGFYGVMAGILSVLKDNLVNYQDGVSETSFGNQQDLSWSGSSVMSFLDYFANKNKGVSDESRKIKFLKSNPLDSGSAQSSIYGSMILGCPYLFNELSDPGNRTLINTFIKDSRFLSLTPGLPKYNGLTSYSGLRENSILNQTSTPDKMLNYLTRNGLDSSFSEKDKRFYTFQTKYEDYFAYLEAMLNVIWIKLGLAKNGETFNLLTFFKIKTDDNSGGIDPNAKDVLLSQFNSSIGFFVNSASILSEDISNMNTNTGSELSERANSNSDTYQRINYITGMGTGGAAKNVARTAGIVQQSISNIRSLLQDTFASTTSAIQNFNSTANDMGKVIAFGKIALAAANDVTTFTTTQDLPSILQSFATTNGMKVVYPELWNNSSYSKNINLSFSFVSPYGDPMSIFKYVYVPFCALACFAMPRQAAENGYVSPFFVRADVPGLFCSDLAMISSMSWTKGGANALWTKDGLPRAIDVTISLADLYPYLSMTKRISYLSANPSYAVWLDSFTGMLAVNDGSEDDQLNIYFKEMINRVNGLENSAGSKLWNKFNKKKSKMNVEYANRYREPLSLGMSSYNIPWFHNSSL